MTPIECTCGTDHHPPPCPIGDELFEMWKADRDMEECERLYAAGELVEHTPEQLAEIPF